MKARATGYYSDDGRMIYEGDNITAYTVDNPHEPLAENAEVYYSDLYHCYLFDGYGFSPGSQTYTIVE